jgi:hypothetical protein
MALARLHIAIYTLRIYQDSLTFIVNDQLGLDTNIDRRFKFLIILTENNKVYFLYDYKLILEGDEDNEMDWALNGRTTASLRDVRDLVRERFGS